MWRASTGCERAPDSEPAAKFGSFVRARHQPAVAVHEARVAAWSVRSAVVKREAALRRRHPRMARAASAGGSARHSDPEIEPQRVAPGWATTIFAPHIL